MKSVLSEGFLFALGWFLARIAMSFAAGFISELLYRLCPPYKEFMDEQDRKKHPWRYNSKDE